MSEKKRKEIVVIAKGSGISNFYSAANTKCYYIAKILEEGNFDVTILSSIYYQEKPLIKTKGEYCGIAFYAPSVYEKTNLKTVLIINKIIHGWRVIKYLLFIRLTKGKSYYIFDDNSVFLPILLILDKLNVIELIFNIEEWPLAHNISWLGQYSAHYFSVLAIKSCKKIICVSSFLAAKTLEYNKKSKTIILPAITIFDKFKENNQFVGYEKSKLVRFLYCGNIGYYEVIEEIIESFDQIATSRIDVNIELVLILSGDSSLLDKIYKRITGLHSIITIKKQLTRSELLDEYSKATCFFAPLRDTLQDQARFPQKLSEYTSFSKPIITTNVGDIGKYFQHEKNAIFIDDFSTKSLVEKINYVIDNLELVHNIGIEGKNVGLKFFDYKQYVSSLEEFVSS